MPLLLLLSSCCIARPATAQAAEDKRIATQWVQIPGGTFVMGRSVPLAEEAVHRATVTAFGMAKTLVTFRQYRACVKAGACTPPHVSDGTCKVFDGTKIRKGNLPVSFQGEDQPVVCIDWAQAAAYSKWVGGRLPSEAEWEYAARGGGENRAYPWGDEAADCLRAVMNVGRDGAGCGRNATWPVCSKPAGNTKQGICDMSGNVYQWMGDWYGAEPWRAIRGGSWLSGASLTAAERKGEDPASPHSTIGCRPVRTTP